MGGAARRAGPDGVGEDGDAPGDAGEGEGRFEHVALVVVAVGGPAVFGQVARVVADEGAQFGQRGRFIRRQVGV